MKLKDLEYIFKIFLLLICFGFISIFEMNIIDIKNIKINILEKYNLRFLLGSTIDYDSSSRKNKDDLESIENCEKTDFKYFVEYITGHNITFDKYVDKERAVSNLYI